MWCESGECARSGAVAALRGRELRRVHPRVLARYGGLGLASLPEHVLALGQPLRVLVLGLTNYFEILRRNFKLKLLYQF